MLVLTGETRSLPLWNKSSSLSYKGAFVTHYRA